MTHPRFWLIPTFASSVIFATAEGDICSQSVFAVFMWVNVYLVYLAWRCVYTDYVAQIHSRTKVFAGATRDDSRVCDSFKLRSTITYLSLSSLENGFPSWSLVSGISIIHHFDQNICAQWYQRPESGWDMDTVLTLGALIDRPPSVWHNYFIRLILF